MTRRGQMGLSFPWAYRIRSTSTILINLSSRTAAASTTGTVLDAWGVKVVLLYAIIPPLGGSTSRYHSHQERGLFPRND